MSILSQVSYKSERLGESYTKILHSSGLKIYVFPKKLTTAYAMFSTEYGALERTFRLKGESDYITVPDGVAHFLEHKMFEQEDGTDIFATFAGYGANANAYTSHENTAYLFSTVENVYESLEALVSFVMHPYFTEQNVAKEQGIIGQEIDMCNDRPITRLYYLMLEGLYVNHNAKINIAGTKETIAEITPDILYRCYRTFYRPSNMVLAISGDVTVERVMEIVERNLPEHADTTEIECVYPDESAEIACAYAELEMEVAKPLFAFGVKDLSEFADARARAKHEVSVSLLNRLLFGTSSAFYADLYKRGLIADDFTVEYDSLRSCAYNMIYGESADPDAVYAEMMKLISALPSNPPRREDFERIHRATYAKYIKSFDSTEDIASELIHGASHGVEMMDMGDVIRGVTYDDIVALATTYYTDKTFTRAIIRPIQSKEK